MKIVGRDGSTVNISKRKGSTAGGEFPAHDHLVLECNGEKLAELHIGRRRIDILNCGNSLSKNMVDINDVRFNR